METTNVRAQWFRTMRTREDAAPDAGIFEADGDEWALVEGYTGPQVVWIRGKHFLETQKARTVTFRTNPRSKKIYLQFQRPRLYGETRMKVLCVPASAINEVYEEVPT